MNKEIEDAWFGQCAARSWAYCPGMASRRFGTLDALNAYIATEPPPKYPEFITLTVDGGREAMRAVDRARSNDDDV